MLVDDVPQIGALEHVEGVRHLEYDDGVAPITDRATQAADELEGLLDVLEELARNHQVRLQIEVRLGVELLDEGQTLIGLSARRGLVAPVEPGASVVAELDHHLQELALAAADFQYELLAQVVSVDEVVREVRCVSAEERRVMQRCDVVLVVV